MVRVWMINQIDLLTINGIVVVIDRSDLENKQLMIEYNNIINNTCNVYHTLYIIHHLTLTPYLYTLIFYISLLNLIDLPLRGESLIMRIKISSMT